MDTTLHSTFYILHSTFYILHFTFCIYIPHAAGIAAAASTRSCSAAGSR